MTEITQTDRQLAAELGALFGGNGLTHNQQGGVGGGERTMPHSYAYLCRKAGLPEPTAQTGKCQIKAFTGGRESCEFYQAFKWQPHRRGAGSWNFCEQHARLIAGNCRNELAPIL